MNTTYLPYDRVYAYGKTSYIYNVEYTTTGGQHIYVTYKDPNVVPKSDPELDLGDTKLLDEFLQGFGVK